MARCNGFSMEIPRFYHQFPLLSPKVHFFSVGKAHIIKTIFHFALCSLVHFPSIKVWSEFTFFTGSSLFINQAYVFHATIMFSTFIFHHQIYFFGRKRYFLLPGIWACSTLWTSQTISHTTASTSQELQQSHNDMLTMLQAEIAAATGMSEYNPRRMLY